MKATKAIGYTTALAFLLAGNLYGQSAQDSTGLPGDNFSLEGALEVFSKAESPEEFERLLNQEDNRVNNLDLNGDGNIDYIKVLEKQDGDAHAFVLQAAVSETENQDVAVIEMEKRGNEEVALQIVGDEDIYGDEVIVEPARTQAQQNVVVNVSAWPSVRYVYRPYYRPWISPWGWRAHPAWWRPWRPVGWRVFYPYHTPYRHRYVVVHTHTVVHAHRVYVPARTTSVIVRDRHRTSVTQYRSTHTRVATPARRREVGRTRQTTVQTPRGNTRTRTTTTKARKRGH